MTTEDLAAAPTEKAEALGDDTSSGGATDPRVGTVVGNYEITRILGRGGMGAVYEARHTMIGRHVAIKFLLPEAAANRDNVGRFEDEAKTAGSLAHPNLVVVNDLGRMPDGAPHLIMEYLEGEDCRRLLRRQGKLPVERAADIVLQACRGLAFAHKAGIIHRDLKPENLFLTKSGDGRDVVKVLDFGIAKLRNDKASVATRTGATFGTAHYMSPEQARNAADVDERADVWSLGVVLFELLSGRKPFNGDGFIEILHQILDAEPPALSSLRPELPRALVNVVRRAMKKDANERISTVIALGQALASFAGQFSSGGRGTVTITTPTTDVGLEERTESPNTTPPGESQGATFPRRRWPFAIAIAAGISIGAAGIMFLRARSSGAPEAKVTDSSQRTLSTPASPPPASPPPASIAASPPPPSGPSDRVPQEKRTSSSQRPSAPRKATAKISAAPPKSVPEEPPVEGRGIDIDFQSPYKR